ncbi:hypothetical protein V5799_011440 [Amblyomma americanum]|uniref:Hexosyltransferase n=1 Tax=Amblyomma americanum TaxID=6943 RepID=A0AAQ4EH97_AMBAM
MLRMSALLRCSVPVIPVCLIFGGVFVVGLPASFVIVLILAVVVFACPSWKRLTKVLNCGDAKSTLMTASADYPTTPMLRRAKLVRALQTPRVKWLIIASVVVLILETTGLYTMCWETPYSRFTYPLEVDARELLRALEEGRVPGVSPINSYERYRFKIRNERKCAEVNGTVRLLLLVKSALKHVAQRDAIRRSWGFESRFADVVIKRVFVLGTGKPEMQDEVDAEYARHRDLPSLNAETCPQATVYEQPRWPPGAPFGGGIPLFSGRKSKTNAEIESEKCMVNADASKCVTLWQKRPWLPE